MILISLRDSFADLPPSILKKRIKEIDEKGDWQKINTKEEFLKLKNVKKDLYGYDAFFGTIAHAGEFDIIFREKDDTKWGYGSSEYYYSPTYNCLLTIFRDILNDRSKESIFKKVIQLLKAKAKSMDYPYEKND